MKRGTFVFLSSFLSLSVTFVSSSAWAINGHENRQTTCYDGYTEVWRISVLTEGNYTDDSKEFARSMARNQAERNVILAKNRYQEICASNIDYSSPDYLYHHTALGGNYQIADVFETEIPGQYHPVYRVGVLLQEDIICCVVPSSIFASSSEIDVNELSEEYSYSSSSSISFETFENEPDEEYGYSSSSCSGGYC